MDFGFYRTIKQLIMSNGLHSFCLFKERGFLSAGVYSPILAMRGEGTVGRNCIGIQSVSQVKLLFIPYSLGLISKFSWNGDLKVGLEAHVMFCEKSFSASIRWRVAILFSKRSGFLFYRGVELLGSAA